MQRDLRPLGKPYHCEVLAKRARSTRPDVVASIETRGKGGTEGRTLSGDVKLAYNANARDKREHFHSAPIFSKAGRLANELRTYYRDGWGKLDNDQHGRALFSILLHTIAHTGGHEDRQFNLIEINMHSRMSRTTLASRH